MAHSKCVCNLIRTAQPQCQPKWGRNSTSDWQYKQQLSQDPLGIPAVLLPSSSFNHPSQITPYAHSLSQAAFKKQPACKKNILNSLTVHIQPQLYTAKVLTQLSGCNNTILCKFTYIKKIWCKEGNRLNN